MRATEIRDFGRRFATEWIYHGQPLDAVKHLTFSGKLAGLV
jgi:hypothetical protein